MEWIKKNTECNPCITVFNLYTGINWAELFEFLIHNYKQPLLEYAIIHVIIPSWTASCDSFVSSWSISACEDSMALCRRLKKRCNKANIKRKCPKTCNTCWIKNIFYVDIIRTYVVLSPLAQSGIQRCLGNTTFWSIENKLRIEWQMSEVSVNLHVYNLL